MKQSPVNSGRIFTPRKTPRGGEILRYARNLRGFTQAESAASYGIEERTLRRWENREFDPRWNDVISLVEDVYLLDILEVMAKINHDDTYNN